MIYLYISLFALILLVFINITERFYFIKKFTIYSVDFETHDEAAEYLHISKAQIY